MAPLRAREVHIWLARQPESSPVELESVLMLEERARARRFRFPEHRAAYVFAHAVTRHVLSLYLLNRPGDIRFGKNAFGKPFVNAGTRASELEFNLSHSGRLVVIGVCRRAIGVDVEEIRPVHDVAAIVTSYFTPRECAFILQQDASDRLRAFLRCWTRKEAYVKALGGGLSIPLNTFDTLLSGEGSNEFSHNSSACRTAWQLSDLEVGQSYLASVAIEAGFDRLVQFEWASRGA